MEFVEDRKKQLLSVSLMLILMIATAYFVFKDESPIKLLNAMSGVKFRYIFIGVALMIFYICCEGINIHMCMKSLADKSNLIKSLGYAFVGFYFSSITPSSTGGQPAQVYYMKRDKIKISHSSLTLIIILVTHQFVMLALALGTFLLNLNFRDAGIGNIKALLIYGIIANTLIVVLMSALMRSKWTVEKIAFGALYFLNKIKIIKNVSKYEKMLRKVLDDYEEGANYIKENPSLIVKVTLVTFFQVTAMYSVPYVVYKAFGLSQYSYMQLLYLQSILNLAVSSLPIPGSVGASEASFLKLFSKLFGKNLLVPAMLITRIVSFYLILIISGVISFMLYLFKEDQNSSPHKVKVEKINDAVSRIKEEKVLKLTQ